MEKQLKKERNKKYVKSIIYDHDACSIWEDVWICIESNLGDHENHILHCVASGISHRTGIYGVDVDRISGSFSHWNCIDICMQKLNHGCVEKIVIC